MNKILKGIVNPFWALKRIYYRPYLTNYRRLKQKTLYDFKDKIVSSKYEDYDEIIEELFTNKKLIREVQDNIVLNKNLDTRESFPHEKYSWPTFMYYLVRKLKPDIIVETGCFSGVSTTHILAALDINKSGKLYTIDKPAYGDEYTGNPNLNEKERFFSLPQGQEPGYLVPDYLRNNWNLILGTADKELPKLSDKLGSIDIFLHDSLHTYENMYLEFTTVFPYLRSHGLILADNINWNNAFRDFSIKNNLKAYSYIAYYDSNENLKQFRRGSTDGHNFGAIIKGE